MRRSTSLQWKKRGQMYYRTSLTARKMMQSTGSKDLLSHCLKITQMVAFEILAFSPNFCPIKTDLSGNII